MKHNYIEFIASLFSMLGVWLTARQVIWCWFFAFIGLVLTFFVFFSNEIFLQALLQVFYIGMTIFGWYSWKYGGNEEEELKISNLKLSNAYYYIIITIILTLVLGYFFKNYTNDPSPWLDAFTSVAGFITTFLMAKKILQHWLIWIFIDVILVIMCFLQELYMFSLLYFIYIILAVYGYLQWKKDLIKN